MLSAVVVLLPPPSSSPVELKTVTRAPGSAVPLTPALLVIRSVAEPPVSWARAMVTIGAVVSRVKVTWLVPMLPAALVCDTVRVCTPSARPTGVKFHVPMPPPIFSSDKAKPSPDDSLGTSSPMTGTVAVKPAPSVTVTVVPASPVPLRLGSLVIASVSDLPVSSTRAMVTTGRTVLR